MVTSARTMSPAAIEKLEEARCRLTCLLGDFWRKVLTEEERQLLGGSRSKAFPLGVAGMWQKLHGCSEPRAVIESITALGMLSKHERKWLIEEIGESEDDVEAAIQAAVETGHLVLVARPREVYWNRQPIEIDWASKSTLWNYFWELASHSKRGVPLDQSAFGDKPRDPNVLKKWKSRLFRTKGFPKDLKAKFGKAGTGTQTLDLPPAEIHLIQIVTTETLRPALC